MDTIIIVVVICVLVGMVVLMFRYAGFIHQGPSPDHREEKQTEDQSDEPSTKDKG
ncbi:MAG: hypothetical protein OEZ51_01145 [Nitrospinota bacterium]|nr:hypothetical protein [Nitrospinota bacterium]